MTTSRATDQDINKPTVESKLELKTETKCDLINHFISSPKRDSINSPASKNIIPSYEADNAGISISSFSDEAEIKKIPIIENDKKESSSLQAVVKDQMLKCWETHKKISHHFPAITDDTIDFQRNLADVYPGNPEILTLSPASPLLQQCYTNFLVDLYANIPLDVCREGMTHSDRNIQVMLHRLTGYINSLLKYDEKACDRIVENWEKDQASLSNESFPVIPLDHFITHEAGVCRHQTLLWAFLCDKLIKDGLLPSGEIHVHGGMVSNGKKGIGQGQGHAWGIYRRSNGELYLVDPANHFLHNFNSSHPIDMPECYEDGKVFQEMRERYLPTKEKYFFQKFFKPIEEQKIETTTCKQHHNKPQDVIFMREKAVSITTTTNPVAVARRF